MQLEIKNTILHGFIEHPKLCRLVQCTAEVSCKFTTGLNFIFCNLQDDGWAVSHAICDGSIVAPYPPIEIILNNKIISIKELNEMSYYVGAEKDKYQLPDKRWHRVKKSINDRLKAACKTTGKSIDEIKKLFILKEERCSIPITWGSSLLEEHSTAIGFAQGKRIFCFPWMREGIAGQSYNRNWEFYVDIAKEHDLIFVIPHEPLKNSTSFIFDYNIVNLQIGHSI